MKREVEREVRLPAFALQMGEMELLWQRMQQLFESTMTRKESIELSLPSERIQFDSLDELKAYKQIRGRVTNFTLRISQGSTSVTVKTGGLFSNVPTLKAEGDSDIWCAGAVEAVISVVLRNRMWYWWLIRAPLMLLFVLAAMTPYLHNWLLSRELKMSPVVAMAWLSIVFTLGFIAFTRDRLLPTAALVFTNDLGFIRRYGAELGLALGVISLIASLFMWLYPAA
jgi:hypothetical protein